MVIPVVWVFEGHGILKIDGLRNVNQAINELYGVGIIFIFNNSLR